MVTKSGLVKLLDFGLAQIEQAPFSESASTGTMGPAFLTKPGTILGTAAYMSPEQAQAKEMDQRSDIFSLASCSIKCSLARCRSIRTPKWD